MRVGAGGWVVVEQELPVKVTPIPCVLTVCGSGRGADSLQAFDYHGWQFFIDSFLSLYFAYLSNVHVILSCKVPVGLRLELLQNCFFFNCKNKLVNVSKLK